jgi:hypothetical protein
MQNNLRCVFQNVRIVIEAHHGPGRWKVSSQGQPTPTMPKLSLRTSSTFEIEDSQVGEIFMGTTKTVAVPRDLLKAVTNYIDNAYEWQDTDEHRKEIEDWSEGLHAAINGSYPVQH